TSQPRRCRLCQKERAFHVRIERRIPNLFGRGNHARRQKIRRAVHQHIDPSKLMRHALHKTPNLLDARQLRFHRSCPPPQFFNLMNNRARFFFRFPKVHCNIGALARKPQRYNSPEPFPRSCHQRHFPVQFHFHRLKLSHSPHSLYNAHSFRRLHETRSSSHSRPSRRCRTHLRRHHAQNGTSRLQNRHPRPYRRRNGHARQSQNSRQRSRPRRQNPQG